MRAGFIGRFVYVAVGSGNPVKEAAVSATLGDRADRVTREIVDSGVSDQPRGHSETLRGAETRATRAFEAGDYDMGIGLEGGITEPGFTTGTYLIMWGVATDGERVARAAGPQFQLPDPVAESVHDGRELGPALDDHLGREGTKYEEGAAGVISKGLTERSEALGQAVAGAVGPLLD